MTDNSQPLKDTEGTKEAGLSESLLSKLDFSVDTKSGIANITTWITTIMYLLFLHIFLLPLKLPDKEGSYLPYLFVAFVPQAVQLIMFGGDTIAHSSNKRSLFFQSCFPASYISQKHSVSASKGNFLWFAIFDKKIMSQNRRRTYKYGYTCRLIYHLYYICVSLLFASVSVVLCRAAWGCFHKEGLAGSLCNALGATSTPLVKSIYLVHVSLLAVYLRRFNQVTLVTTENKRVPLWRRVYYLFGRHALKQAVDSREVCFRVTGVWVRWEEINGRNRAWLELNTPDLTSLENLAKLKE